MNDTAENSELMIRLRHGIRKSRQLAEELTKDPRVSDEAATLLARLHHVAAELNAIKALELSRRQIENDPIWLWPEEPTSYRSR